MQVIPARGLKRVELEIRLNPYHFGCNAGNSREGFETSNDTFGYSSRDKSCNAGNSREGFETLVIFPRRFGDLALQCR